MASHRESGILVVLGSALLLGTAAVQEAAPPRPVVVDDAPRIAPSTQAELERLRQEWGIPAVAASIVVGEAIAFSGAAGIADLEANAPATPLTKFRLGSVSKLLTATLAARLARDGDLDLDRDVRVDVPSWPDEGPPITLRQLLGHFGGIRHYEEKDFDRRCPGGPIDLRLYPDTEAALELFCHDPLVAPPGSRSHYSTFGFTLVAAAIEGATGERFVEVMEERLLAPLGLAGEIVVDDPRAIVPHRAAPYDLAGADEASPKSVVHAWPMNSAYKIAGGGYLATADAVARFGSALFGPGALDRETLDLLLREQVSASGTPAGIALGWRVGRDGAGRRIFHHSGSQQGCRALLLVYPDAKVAIAWLSNLTNVPGPVVEIGERLAAPYLALAER